ncbi:MAG: glycoside hydrolase [Deltaproteobacteria bacterium CG11_big_fil_rev_8_21_14_0_20_49_13]|nr:MAG: glycoside hydrolase [Deltaproteobacteria bacterium CG11_big_fil_rev_8_21_14_0_20_49_13]
MTKGFLSFVLHAHLPYVRHPEHDDFLEERWFYEAITETYVPLLTMMDGLERDNVYFRLTMSLTPPLLSMMTDPLLQDRYVRHIKRLVELAEKEVWRTGSQPEFNRTAHMYLNKFRHARRMFEEKYGRNLINGFKHFQDIASLEIITCGATHGFLPLLRVSPEAVKGQIEMAVRHYTDHFGRAPRGIWLPECGYFPGLDDVLARYGIKFFFVDSHAIIHADSRPKYGVYSPLYCPSGIAAFGRDYESSKQVWSAQEGYPGDGCYRDFYRDIGFDLDFEYIKPYIHRDGIRIMTGVKYHKITGKTSHKEPYDPHAAWEKTAEHAGNFVFNRVKQAEYLCNVMNRQPIIVAPYDAELYGHWWYEGIDWLNFVIRKMACDQDVVKLITPLEFLQIYPKNQMAYPSESSWGNKGYADVWCNQSNDWIYRHLHEAAWRITELARKFQNPDDNLRRTLNQMARELLLAQSSDWAFIMNSGTMVEYAVKRTKEHIFRFNKLYDDILNLRLDMNFVSELEWKDNIFPNIDYKIYG